MLRKIGSHFRDQWIGTLALFLVLSGGTAYAVTQIDANSVRSSHIVNGQVKSADVKDDGLTGVDIDESSLDGAVRTRQLVLDPPIDPDQTTTVTEANFFVLPGLGRFSAKCHRNPGFSQVFYENTTANTVRAWVGDSPEAHDVPPGGFELGIPASRAEWILRSSDGTKFAFAEFGHSWPNGPNDCFFVGRATRTP